MQEIIQGIWTVPGSNSGRGEIFHTGPGARPSCYAMGTGSFPGGGKAAGAWR